MVRCSCGNLPAGGGEPQKFFVKPPYRRPQRSLDCIELNLVGLARPFIHKELLELDRQHADGLWKVLVDPPGEIATSKLHVFSHVQVASHEIFVVKHFDGALCFFNAKHREEAVAFGAMRLAVVDDFYIAHGSNTFE